MSNNNSKENTPSLNMSIKQFTNLSHEDLYNGMSEASKILLAYSLRISNESSELKSLVGAISCISYDLQQTKNQLEKLRIAHGILASCD